MIQFKRFDKADWMSFSGAELFMNGDQPWVSYDLKIDGEIDSVVLVSGDAIANASSPAKHWYQPSIEIDVCRDEGYEFYSCEGHDAMNALLVLCSLPENKIGLNELKRLGFKRIN